MELVADGDLPQPAAKASAIAHETRELKVFPDERTPEAIVKSSQVDRRNRENAPANIQTEKHRWHWPAVLGRGFATPTAAVG